VQRRIANENELTAAFENEPLFKGNVKALDFGASSWSFEHQAQVMRETDVLVGFHGAQLVNALWLPHGSTVIEVFARGHHRYTYDHIRYVFDV
jgi:capsular polysaccharide biosynthesis protein